MNSSPWARADALLGVPLTIAADRNGSVVSYAARALQRREGIDERRALARTASALGTVFDASAVVCEQALVRVDLRAAEQWLKHLILDGTALAQRAVLVRQQQPRIRSQGNNLVWSRFVDAVGLDAAVWAVLGSASRAAPYVVGSSLRALESRADTHPLALIRRAHAALVVRLEQCAAPVLSADLDVRAVPERDEAAGGLLSELALIDRAAFDGLRTQRSRPVSEAVLTVADAALRYLETTPVTRTNLLLSQVARTVLADALDAAGLAAPVPY